MSDEENKGQGIVKPYLSFIDNNVLFKKPVSCLFAIVSLVIPIYILSLFIQFEVFSSGIVNYIIAAILIVLVLAFAGVFGALIWWHRRIIRDEGPKYYNNFRRFIQTLGEWFATFYAISVFGIIIILMLLLPDDYYYVAGAIPVDIPGVNIVTALYGPIGGVVIIVATKILLFLLDPVIWLIKQIWTLFVRVVLYVYRNILNFFGTVEKNTPIWVGITWLLAGAVVIAAVVLCFTHGGLAPVIGLIAALAFMGYMLFKRKDYNV